MSNVFLKRDVYFYICAAACIQSCYMIKPQDVAESERASKQGFRKCGYEGESKTSVFLLFFFYCTIHTQGRQSQSTLQTLKEKNVSMCTNLEVILKIKKTFFLIL